MAKGSRAGVNDVALFGAEALIGLGLSQIIPGVTRPLRFRVKRLMSQY